MKKQILYHGTSTGEAHATLASIFNHGLLPDKTNPDRCMQNNGVYCVAMQACAAGYARSTSRDKGGDALMVKIATIVDARHWDIDHERTDLSMGLLSLFKPVLARIQPSELNIDFISEWGVDIHEKISKVRCTDKYLYLTVENRKENAASNPLTYKIPWSGREDMSLSFTFNKKMGLRLQALHDYLRRTSGGDYIGGLQEVLDTAEVKQFPIKYTGSTGLIAEQYDVNLLESDYWITIDPAHGYDKKRALEKARSGAAKVISIRC